MAYIDVNGVKTYYEKEGSGKPLILIHGASQDTLSWRFNISFFANYFTTYAIDLPGHGKSYPLNSGPVQRTEDYASFISDFIRTLNIDNPILMGHSMAGGISLACAATNPELISGVVVVDGAAYTVNKIVSYNNEVMELARLNPTDWFEGNFRTLCGSNTEEQRIKEIAFDARRCSPEVAIGDLTAYTSFDLSSSIAKIKKPVLLVEGSEDWSCPPEAVELTYEKLNCPKDYILLKEVGHFPHTEQPDYFNQEVLEGLSRLDLIEI